MNADETARKIDELRRRAAAASKAALNMRERAIRLLDQAARLEIAQSARKRGKRRSAAGGSPL
jgi:hypothetical protein